jgi:carboxypeptidase C (cathepsin A)
MKIARLSVVCSLLALLSFAYHLPAQQPKKKAAAAPKAIPLAESVPENSSTKHTLQLNGKTLEYTALVGQMPIKNAKGEVEAYIGYIAYTLDKEGAATRPLTFAFNGGPGSASIWVHMGGMGPRIAKLFDNGDMPPPPFQIVNNDATWLDKTDLVFIDPVGTGYSRAKTEEIARKYNGVQGDIQSVGEFIRLYIHHNQRWASPLFIAGESYGTFRAAGLAGHLIDQGIAVNGICLISTILDYGTVRTTQGSSLSYSLFLPTYTADAWYHKRLPPDLQKRDLQSTLNEAERWAMNGYRSALDKGDRLTPAERKEALDQLSRFTGLGRDYLDQNELRFGVQQFTRQLLRDRKLTIGRLDGRLTGPSPLNAGETAEFDPSSTLIRPPFQAAFFNYLQTELKYNTDMTYYVSGGIAPWDYGLQNGYAETASALRNAFAKNPHLKVLVCASYYDLATPYFAAQHTFSHMGLHPEMQKNVSWRYYEAGHMMYIVRDCRAQLKRDMAEFIQSCLKK